MTESTKEEHNVITSHYFDLSITIDSIPVRIKDKQLMNEIYDVVSGWAERNDCGLFYFGWDTKNVTYKPKGEQIDQIPDSPTPIINSPKETIAS